ncbi:class II fructose-bisphosphate aldolase [Youxingia wuxianensis]|uniref:Class II fructose-bisphosphate aldolase n=1 Tax=Youxingia wuxianensis TaxID=2763678 RepID=A0A926IHV1_9FIRM|nr:class II fructose-bisphosphate aldolase [Youxingia wuxianensis]MBC8585691.1 class II fructose-bisphosphate aldolase [Youxingia wuxianensis]
MLVNLTDMFSQHGNYAIAAFNVFGYEDAVSVIRAAEEVNEPVILMVNRDAARHMPLDILGPILTTLAKQAKVPVDVHLDHSVDLESIAKAVDAGFTSVMFDGSQLSFEENVDKTLKTIALARPKNISVEAEIGSVAYSDPSIQAKMIYTEPEEALRFYQATQVDCLAVSVGTVHRMVVQEAKLQFDRLEKLKNTVEVPLVIHGSTGVPDADLTKLSRYGARKINIGTCLRMAFGRTLRKCMEENPEEFDRIKLFQEPMKAVQQAAKQKIQLLKY